MIDLSKIHDFLLDIPYISSIRRYENNSRFRIAGFDCDLIIFDGTMIPIFIGIPEDWDQRLFKIYIRNYQSFKFIPHVNKDGKICLFDLEGVLIDNVLNGLLEQCLKRAKLIIERGLYSNNDSEFAREFSSYWVELPAIRRLKFAAPNKHETQLIKYIDNSVGLKRKKGESEIVFSKRKNRCELFAAADSQYFNLWGKRGTQYNGIFVHFESEEYVLPPDPREGLKIDYVENLLNKIPPAELINCKSKISSKNVLIVLEILEPDKNVIYFGLMLNDADFVIKEDRLFLKSVSHTIGIIPIDVSRIDEEFIIQRTHNMKIKESPKVLLIGCGSIGGYLCSEMVKSGYKNLTLIDNDILKPENVYRHFLGIKYVNKYKTVALKEYCDNSFPNISISTIEEDIRDLIETDSVCFENFDLIISATGNQNINRWINRQIYVKEIDMPCIYLWNEPIDVGCHIAVINHKYSGCYNCFFDRNSKTKVLYDTTAYSEPGQIVTKNNYGCSGSFMPYASNVSLRVVATCLEWIERIVTDRCNENVLVSIKGDAYNFIKEGYKCSAVYYEQQDKEKIIKGSDFKNINCELCGESAYDR